MRFSLVIGCCLIAVTSGAASHIDAPERIDCQRWPGETSAMGACGLHANATRVLVASPAGTVKAPTGPNPTTNAPTPTTAKTTTAKSPAASGAPPNGGGGKPTIAPASTGATPAATPSGDAATPTGVKPCPPPFKEGSLVNGKCVKLIAKHTCPQCDQPWVVAAVCVELLAKGGTVVQPTTAPCKGLPEPKLVNRRTDVICKYCTTCGAAPTTSKRLLMDVAPPPGEFEYVFHRDPSLPANAFVKSSLANMRSAAAPLASFQSDECTCFRRCWNARGAPIDGRGPYYAGNYALGPHHCSFLLFAQTGRTRSGTCNLYATGPMPQAADDDAMDGTGVTGVMGFVAFPRRFDMFRPNCPANQQRIIPVQGNVQFGVCEGNGNVEGTGTYCVGRLPTPAVCAATAETVMDAADFFQQLAQHGGARPIVPMHNIDAAPSLRSAAHPSTDATAYRARGAAHWNFHFDHLYRVTAVRPNSHIAPRNIQIGRSKSPSGFQKFYDYIMRQHQARPTFQAGHLVAATQKPPNFLHNYVPQNALSNVHGCWYTTEWAASDFQRHGCSISYDIRLAYPVEGETPQQTLARVTQTFPWATMTGYTGYDANVNTAATGYSHQCLHRFRPITMSLNFRITRGESGKTCEHLAAPEAQIVNAPLMRFQDGVLQVTRVMAYLIQKNNRPRFSELATYRSDHRQQGDFNWRRLFLVATTLSDVSAGAQNPAIACLADTGQAYPFPRVVLSPRFHHAFLSTETNTLCLARGQGNVLGLANTAAACSKWSFLQDQGAAGVFLSGGGGAQMCVAADATGAIGLATANCLMLTYARAQQIETTGANPVQIAAEDVITATLQAPNSRCVMVNPANNQLGLGAPTATVPCLRLRVSYYPVSPTAAAVVADNTNELAQADAHDETENAEEGVEYTAEELAN